jgi:hypothetical protein
MRLFPFLGDKGSSITSIFISSCSHKFKLSNAYIIRYIDEGVDDENAKQRPTT